MRLSSRAVQGPRPRRRRPSLEALEGRQLLAAIVEYPGLGIPGGALAIVTGPDGALWFTENSTGRIGRITTGGALTEFPIPRTFSPPLPTGITAGPDGALWFTEYGTGKIGRITTGGSLTESPTAGMLSGPGGITTGPDGALWFTAFGSNSIGRITTGGEITQFLVPTSGSLAGSIESANNITAGPDGALWFTESGADKIGRITTDGSVTEFPVPTPGSRPNGITAGPDGALWFTESGANKIGRITTDGSVTEFPVPTPGGFGEALGSITAGPDGALWFTESGADKIGRITTDGSVTEFPVPTPNSRPIGITTGPDGALWFTEFTAGKIGRLDLRPQPPTVVALRRLGFHAEPTRVVLGFSTPLDPARAQDLRNYRIVGPDGKAVVIDSATYDPAANTVTLRPHVRLNLHRFYQLTVVGTAPDGLANMSGVLLDGAGNGRAGSDYVATLKASDLVLGAEVPGGSRRLANLRRALATIEADQSKQLTRKPVAPVARALVRAHPGKAGGGTSTGKK